MNHRNGVLDSELGPETLYSNQFPGDADVAVVGTSFEEPLDESTPTLEQTQRLFGGNMQNAHPTKDWSGASALGGS